MTTRRKLRRLRTFRRRNRLGASRRFRVRRIILRLDDLLDFSFRLSSKPQCIGVRFIKRLERPIIGILVILVNRLLNGLRSRFTNLFIRRKVPASRITAFCLRSDSSAGGRHVPSDVLKKYSGSQFS